MDKNAEEEILNEGNIKGIKKSLSNKILIPRSNNRVLYKQLYRKAWEQLPEFNGWLEADPLSKGRAFCRICNRSLHAHRLTLLKHTASIRHMKRAKQDFEVKIEELQDCDHAEQSTSNTDVFPEEELPFSECNITGTPKSTGSTTQPKTKVAGHKRRQEETFIENAIEMLQKISDHNKAEPENEFDLFGKSVAVQLRNMPIERALICQQKLQEVLMQERMRQLRQEDLLSRTSSSPMIYVDSPASCSSSNMSSHSSSVQPSFNKTTNQQTYNIISDAMEMTMTFDN